MSLDSTLGVGSTFTVYLPAAPGGDQSPIVAPTPSRCPRSRRRPSLPPARSTTRNRRLHEQADAQLAGKKILVVDDDIRNIFAVTVLLERGDVEVLSAESGEEAIAVLERTPDIDLVLMDIMMPIMDGYATIRAIRTCPGGEQLAIVALTAKTGAGGARALP